MIEYSFRIRTQIRRLLYLGEKEPSKFIGVYLSDYEKKEEIINWFDGGILDYIEGFLDITHYGQSWLDSVEYWNYPIYQWTTGALGYEPVLKDILQNGISFTIEFHSEFNRMFFDSISDTEYLLYMASKTYSFEEGFEVGMYSTREEYDNVEKLFPVVVKKEDVKHEILREGLSVFKILVEYDIYNRDYFQKYLNMYERLHLLS